MPSLRTRLLAVLFALSSVPAAAIAQSLGPATAARSLPVEVRWTVAISARPSAPPVIGAEKIYLALQSGVVAAHRLSDGVETWRVEMRTEQPVALDGNRVFVAAGEAIHALSSDDAGLLWRVSTGVLTAPLLAQDGWVIAASAGELAAFRSEDGAKIWGRETGPQHGRATIEGDNLYVPLDDGRLLALELRTGAERWVRRLATPRAPAGGKPAPALSEVLAYPDRLFLGAADGLFYCLDAGDGTLAWRFRIGAIVRGRPTGDGTRIFITSMDNVLRAFDREAGTLLWHPSVPFRPSAGPVLLGSTVVVAGLAAEVRAFDRVGKPAGQIKLEADLVVAPAFSEALSGTVMAAVTGSLTGQWKLLLAEQGRGVPVVPLTALPGVAVPVGVPEG
ncbi:MAG: PQQ-binding-like beta-propeller repeat protein [Acidobacteriota bacterium]|nr:PQQ-binding-like beta-propeller repeat protein [Acidobacteriota bacterium]